MEDFPITGKIQNDFFKSRVFPYCGKKRTEVKIGPEYGVDVSIVSLPNGLAMAMTSDPLSLIPTLGLRESAWLSVQLMANDMATTGFAPMYAQFVLNLPTTLSADDFEQYWKYIHEYCARLGIAITGGHTGRFDGLNSTVSGGGTMVTIADARDFITSKGAQPGDVLVMTKECAVLATSILALSFPKTVIRVCGEDVHKKACELFYMTSAVEAGLIAGELGRSTKGVTAMHDVTEGGVIGALFEMAYASGCGLEVDEDAIPIGVAQKKIGELFNIDPRHCVGAGAMIIAVQPEKNEMLMSRLRENGIPATLIGKVVNPIHGLTMRRGSILRELTIPPADPYWAAFFNAYNNGLQ